MRDHIQTLIARVNRKSWWHVKPAEASAYRKRGKFLASTFQEAEFYGRPGDCPEKVTIASPVVGDNDTVVADSGKEFLERWWNETSARHS